MTMKIHLLTKNNPNYCGSLILRKNNNNNKHNTTRLQSHLPTPTDYMIYIHKKFRNWAWAHED